MADIEPVQGGTLVIEGGGNFPDDPEEPNFNREGAPHVVDSEPLATSIVSQEFMRAGFPLTPDIIARYFTGRRPADMFAEVEIAAGRKLPPDFAATVASATLRRFRAELRATAHMAQGPRKSSRRCSDINESTSSTASRRTAARAPPSGRRSR